MTTLIDSALMWLVKRRWMRGRPIGYAILRYFEDRLMTPSLSDVTKTEHDAPLSGCYEINPPTEEE